MRNYSILYIMLPVIIFCGEIEESRSLISLGGNISYGRKYIAGGEEALTFRRNRPIGSIDVSVGFFEFPVKLKYVTSIIPESFAMSDVTISEKGIGIQPEYRHGVYTFYGVLGQMDININNNHVGMISDAGEGYWAGFGFRKKREGKADFGLEFRYSTGEKLMFMTNLENEPNKIYSFDMGGYSMSITWGIENIFDYKFSIIKP